MRCISASGPAEALNDHSCHDIRAPQDTRLLHKGLAWQQAVRSAYDQYIACPAFTAECGGRAVSWEEFVWGVASVESRAFGIKVGLQHSLRGALTPASAACASCCQHTCVVLASTHLAVIGEAACAAAIKLVSKLSMGSSHCGDLTNTHKHVYLHAGWGCGAASPGSHFRRSQS